MTRALRVPLLPLGALLIALAVWSTADVQRRAAERGAERVAAAQSQVTAMLDQETGLRGYLLTGDDEFLEPYESGRRRFETADRRMDALLEGHDELEALERRGDVIAHRWQTAARARLGAGRRVPVAEARQRKALMDAFRATNTDLVDRLDTRRVERQRLAALVSAALAFFVLLVVGGAGSWFARRRRAAERRREEREHRYVTTQAEFAARKEQWGEDKQVRWGPTTDAAEVAYVLYQAPALVAVHAAEMLAKTRAGGGP